ncbi:MAG TPA: OsmC family protein [Ilumatobacter sp.]|nr:OsmC family protein [Ilumatobacter sp.]
MSNPDVRSIDLERVAAGRYVAANERGGSISIGSGATEDFTPVELLLAAIASCGAIDLDLVVTKRAEPTTFLATASGEKVRDDLGNRLTGLDVQFTLAFPDDQSGVDAWSVVSRTLQQIVDRLCTVSRTVAIGTPVHIDAGGVSE